MFRHQGKKRTFLHNLRLATLLSFVAGIVNITGVLAVKTLTTNVTGHFAFFAEEIIRQDFTTALTFFVLTLFFLSGAFISNFLTEIVSIKHPNLSHLIPISVEMIVLVYIAFFGIQSDLSTSLGKWIAFSMQWQLHAEYRLMSFGFGC